MDRQLSYVENRLVVGIKLANQRIFEAACKDIKFKGMGTTIVSGQVVGDKFYIAHVGDSRCYRIRGGGIQQMTRDHSLLEDYKDAKPNMSEEEQRNFPHKNVITRALGMRETVQVDVLAHDIQDRDVFLLCSDGLSGMVEDAKIAELVKASPDLETRGLRARRRGEPGRRHRQHHGAGAAMRELKLRRREASGSIHVR